MMKSAASPSAAVAFTSKKRRNVETAPETSASSKAAKTPKAAAAQEDAASAADAPSAAAVPLAEQQQSREDAIAYLATYATNKPAWKFNKKTQTYLLKWFAHRAGCHSLPKSSFDHFLLYIAGMQGAAAVQLLASANAVLSENAAKHPELAQGKAAAAAADENDAAAVALREARRECLRARKVVQIVEATVAAAAAAK